MEIIWLPRAVDELEAAQRYIAEANIPAARRVLQAVLAAVSRLADLPHIGRPGRVEGTRELVVVGTPYVVAYATIEDRVVVLAVLHGRQKWPESFC